MKIREITAADRTGIAATFRRAFAGPPWNENWSEESALSMLDEWLRIPQFFGLVAADKEVIVGTVFGRFETCDRRTLFYVKQLCVAPEFQRTGVGADLNRALEEKLKAQGVALLYLHTLRDSPAAGFYSSQQYRCSGQMVMLFKTLV